MAITEKGRWASSILDEKGNMVFGGLTDIGKSVFGNSVTGEPTSPPQVIYTALTKSKISDETSANTTQLIFKFDSDVTAWEVRVNGSGHGTGILADSGSSATAGSEITAIIDWTELYQEGQNKVNIYGQSALGWTAYESDVASVKYCLQLDGIDDYLLVNDNANLQLTDNFIISITFAPKDLSSTSKYLLSKNNRYAVLWEYYNDSTEFYCVNQTGSSARSSSRVTLPNNGKHTVEYQYDGTMFRSSLDGVEWQSTALSFSLTPDTSPIYIGGANATTSLFEGILYDVKIYKNGTLYLHYDMSTGTVQDQSGNGNHATLYGNPTWIQV